MIKTVMKVNQSQYLFTTNLFDLILFQVDTLIQESNILLQIQMWDTLHQANRVQF